MNKDVNTHYFGSLLWHKAGQEGRGEILLENSLGDDDATREK